MSHVRKSASGRWEARYRGPDARERSKRFATKRDAVRFLDVREWVADLDASGLAPSTVHKAYQTLAKVLRAAVDGGLIA